MDVCAQFYYLFALLISGNVLLSVQLVQWTKSESILINIFFFYFLILDLTSCVGNIAAESKCISFVRYDPVACWQYSSRIKNKTDWYIQSETVNIHHSFDIFTIWQTELQKYDAKNENNQFGRPIERIGPTDIGVTSQWVWFVYWWYFLFCFPTIFTFTYSLMFY